jgi:hypothetical protein
VNFATELEHGLNSPPPRHLDLNFIPSEPMYGAQSAAINTYVPTKSKIGTGQFSFHDVVQFGLADSVVSVLARVNPERVSDQAVEHVGAVCRWIGVHLTRSVFVDEEWNRKVADIKVRTACTCPPVSMPPVRRMATMPCVRLTQVRKFGKKKKKTYCGDSSH